LIETAYGITFKTLGNELFVLNNVSLAAIPGKEPVMEAKDKMEKRNLDRREVLKTMGVAVRSLARRAGLREVLWLHRR